MAILWFSLLARDLLQVVFSGTAIVPDFTVLALVWVAVLRCEDATPLFIPAFVAGLFWDLRWTALPGVTSCAYVLVVATSAWVWSHLPPGRRGNPTLFFVWAIVAHGLSSFLPALLSGHGLGLSSPLVSQQWMALACVLGLTALFIRHGRTHHD
jgi:hypothetical protein